MRSLVHGLVLVLLTGLGCRTAATGPTSASGSTGGSCPPCECKCSGGEDNRAEISALMKSATKKSNHRDGTGCLADLDALAKLDPTTADSLAYLRAQCTMLSGRCDAGKELARKMFAESYTATLGPEQVERSVESTAAMYCEGKMSDRDAMLRSLMAIQMAASTTRKTSEFCEEHHRTIEQLRGRVKPRDVDDHQLANLDQSLVHAVPNCYARAGDCARAWAVYRPMAQKSHSGSKLDAATREKSMRLAFESMVPRCAAAKPGNATP